MDTSLNVTEPIRVVVVDDHPVVCRGVELLIEAAPDVVVVGRGTDCASGHDTIGLTCPDVVLLDLRLPDGLGTHLARSMVEVSEHTQVLIFTAHTDHEALSFDMPRNVRGVILKDIDAIDLVSFIRQAARGEDVRDERVATSDRRSAKSSLVLTSREHDVLISLAAGESNREIAQILGLAPNTVKTYLRTLFQKLEARNRLEAVMKAQSHGLL